MPHRTILTKLNLIAKNSVLHFKDEKVVWVSNSPKTILSFINDRYSGNKIFDSQNEHELYETIRAYDADTKEHIATIFKPSEAIELFDSQKFNIYEFDVNIIPLKVGTEVKILRKTLCKHSRSYIHSLINQDGKKTTDPILDPSYYMVKFDDFDHPQAYFILDVEEI